MADIIDTKYGTNLALAWTSADTKSANDLILKLVVIITTKLKVEMRLRQWKMKRGTPLLPSKRGIASLLNGPSYLAICVAKGNQAVSDCCHYTIFMSLYSNSLCCIQAMNPKTLKVPHALCLAEGPVRQQTKSQMSWATGFGQAA